MSTSHPAVLPLDEHNQRLVENVHPPQWSNPQPSGRYNLVVIGAGTAGLVSAAGAAALGARVALIERHLMGGDCLNYGCVPSKALLRSAHAVHALHTAASYGAVAGPIIQADFGAVMLRVRRLRADISPHDSAARFRDLGVDVYLGDARFVGTDAVEVGGQRLEFSKAIIATGARAAGLPVPGLKEAGYLTNETVFSLTEQPDSLLVIGAGPIGCELAQGFRRLGTDVTIISDGDRLVPREDPDTSALLFKQFSHEGIKVIFKAKIQRVESMTAGKTIFYDRGTGEESALGHQILVAVGRAPNVEGMGLTNADVRYHNKGVIVDDHLRTSNPRIFAVGDVASRFQFTHAAEALARIAIQNALFLPSKKASSLIIPWVTYTSPEIAHVGLSEDEARRQGKNVYVASLNFGGNDRSIVDGDTSGSAKIVADRRSGRILGATLISGHAGESIGELVLAMQQKLKLGDLSQIIHPYPTQAEIIKRLGDSWLKSRFRPWMRRWLQRWFAWRR